MADKSSFVRSHRTPVSDVIEATMGEPNALTPRFPVNSARGGRPPLALSSARAPEHQTPVAGKGRPSLITYDRTETVIPVAPRGKMRLDSAVESVKLGSAPTCGIWPLARVSVKANQECQCGGMSRAILSMLESTAASVAAMQGINPSAPAGSVDQAASRIWLRASRASRGFHHGTSPRSRAIMPAAM
jgi:hypothetical protein